MICKECGAYNPDHASYCKVCAANLKGDSQNTSDTPDVNEPLAHTEEHPMRNFVRSPIWTATSKQDEPVDEPVNDSFSEDTSSLENEIVNEADEMVDEPIDEEVDAKEASEPVLEPEAPTTKWSRKELPRLDDEAHDVPAASNHIAADDDFDDADELDDEYDEYEYVPTTPAQKKKRKKNGPGKLFWFLIATLVVIVCIVVVLVIAFNDKMPEFLQFDSCQSASTATDPATDNSSPNPDESAAPQTTPIPENNDNIVLTESKNSSGDECVNFVVYLNAGETLTLNFPDRDPEIITNTEQVGRSFELVIQKFNYYPNTPLDTADYVVNPDAVITTANGTQNKLNIPSFTLHFETVNMTLNAPIDVPAEGIMAAEGNVLHLEGTVYDHTVTLTINGESQMVYAEGVFSGDYVLKGEEQETITVLAQKNNCVSAQVEFIALPYVFVPEPMTLTVVQGVDALRATTTNKVTVRGTTTPGATLAAATDNTDAANCGSVAVDAQGNYTFDVTFNNSFHGAVSVTINAVKEGHEDASVVCCVTRAYDDRKAFIKAVEYIEVPKPKSMKYLIEHYTDKDLGFRLIGKITEVFEENGYTVVKFSVTSDDTTYNVYIMNQSVAWKPAENIGKKYKLYCSPFGKYGDTDDLFVIAWYAMAD